MKGLTKVLLLMSVLVFVIQLSACGSKDSKTTSDVSIEVTSSNDSAETVSASQSETPASSDNSVSQASAVGTVKAIEDVPQIDATLTDKSVLGEWIDITDDSRFVRITKTESGYKYEDNEGTYTGTFKDGVLDIPVSGSDTAHVYFDVKSNNMIVTYQGLPTKFKKK